MELEEGRVRRADCLDCRIDQCPGHKTPLSEEKEWRVEFTVGMTIFGTEVHVQRAREEFERWIRVEHGDRVLFVEASGGPFVTP